MASFTNENNDEVSILNSVNITSNIRAPGEYKYTYCGENSTETENSFFNFATAWYTTKITPDMQFLCSTYNVDNTALLYFNKKDRCYNLIIYKNNNAQVNDNVSLNEKAHIIIPLPKRTQEPPVMKIFLVADEYILINEIDKRILLLDYSNGNYIPLFEKEDIDKNKCAVLKEYNIIDVFDENYKIGIKLHKCTYVFIYSKDKGKKAFKYFYFLMQPGSFKAYETISLTPLNFGEDNQFTSEPFGLKVLKIFSKDRFNHLGEWYYVFVFVMRNNLIEFISNYQKISLNNILINYNIYKEKNCVTEILSKITEGTQSGKKINLFLHHSIDKLSCLLFLLEIGIILAFPFYITYTPEEMCKALKPKKDILSNEVQAKNEKKIITDTNKVNNEITQFSPEFYCFPHSYHLNGNDCKCVQLSHLNIILALKDKVYIYKRGDQISRYQYSFYEEKLSGLLTFPNCGYAFLLTSNKLIKIIYTDLFDKYYSEDLTANIGLYPKKDLQYPVFELSPDELFQRYAKKFQIKKDDPTEPTNCEVCGRNEKTEKCSECGMTYYCTPEHYKYYFRNYHFFDCILSKYFTKTDLMAIQNADERHMTLYNGLLRTFGQLLNHIFKRIYCSKDYQPFLQHIIIMINIMDKFSFNKNVEELSSQISTKNENDERVIKTLFYIESIFFYFQMNLLKCTFAMKSKLYNLTDCFLKIIKSDLIPLLSRKKTQKNILKYDKIKKTKYNQFNFFFGMKRIFSNIDEIDLSEIYLVNHLFCLSLLVKYKLKINSLIDVKESFTEIFILFESHFSESKLKNIVPYCFYSISFYLVEIGMIIPTIKLLKRMVASFNEKADNKLKALTFYNLGILQYALSDFRIGIHNLEISYKIITDFKLSTIFLLYVLDSLSLAYLNQKSMFKAYILIKTSLNERNKIKTIENELQCIKLNVYLNYIIDLYEYTYITKTRNILKKRKEQIEGQKLINWVLGDEERETVTTEYFVESFMEVIKFVFGLNSDMLSTLHAHNPSKQVNLSKDDTHNDKGNFNIDTSNTSNSYIGKENAMEREDNIDEYEEDIEIKTAFFDSLPRNDQQRLIKLKQSLFKRDIVLRDPLGAIQPFNINYHPIYSEELLEIIRMLKSNFLLKEIFYCFQNEKWRDEYYNYSPDYCLFGLSKYLKLEKIKNMMLIEKSKKIEQFNPQNKRFKEQRRTIDYDSEYIGLAPVRGISTNIDYVGYMKFKKKFDEIKTKHKELDEYFNFKEDYLLFLFTSFKESNTNLDILLENPFVLLNYIYTDVPEKDGKMSEIQFLAKRRQMFRLRSKSYFCPNDLESCKFSEKELSLKLKRERKISEKESLLSEKDALIKNPNKKSSLYSCCYETNFTIGANPMVTIFTPMHTLQKLMKIDSKSVSERREDITPKGTESKFLNTQYRTRPVRQLSSSVIKNSWYRKELLNNANNSLNSSKNRATNENKRLKKHTHSYRKNKVLNDSMSDNNLLTHSNLDSINEDKLYNIKKSSELSMSKKINKKMEGKADQRNISHEDNIFSNLINYNNNTRIIKNNLEKKNSNVTTFTNSPYSYAKKRDRNSTYDRFISSSNLPGNNYSNNINKDFLIRILLYHKDNQKKTNSQTLDEHKNNNTSMNKHSFTKNCSSSLMSETSAKTKPSIKSYFQNRSEMKLKKVCPNIDEIKASLSQIEDDKNNTNLGINEEQSKEQEESSKNSVDEDALKISRNKPLQSNKQSQIVSYQDFQNQRRSKNDIITKDNKISEEIEVTAPKLTKPFSLLKNIKQRNIKQQSISLTIKDLLHGELNEMVYDLIDDNSKHEMMNQYNGDNRTVMNQNKNSNGNQRKASEKRNSKSNYSHIDDDIVNQLSKKSKDIQKIPKEQNCSNEGNRLKYQSKNSKPYQMTDKSHYEKMLSCYKRVENMRSGNRTYNPNNPGIGKQNKKKTCISSLRKSNNEIETIRQISPLHQNMTNQAEEYADSSKNYDNNNSDNNFGNFGLSNQVKITYKNKNNKSNQQK